MNEFKRIAVFNMVVEAKSFTEAARRLGVAKSAVSKQVSLLEGEVGIRLLNRSPRKLSLTEAGALFHQRCLKIQAQTEFALEELRQYQESPTGTLRIACPVDFGTAYVVPVVKAINELHPNLKIDLLFEDKVVNMVEEGIDLSIRVGWLEESNLVAKKLCDVPVVVFASSRYMKDKSLPASPKDLQGFNWISLSLLKSPIRWEFRNKNQIQSVQMNSNHKSNSVFTVESMVAADLGISAIAKYVVDDKIKSGEFVQLLPEWQVESLGVYVVYPHRNHKPSKLRVFLELMEKRMAELKFNTNSLSE